MAVKNWITGARVRTLPLAIAPIFLGSAAANLVDRFNLALAFLAAVVSLSLQIGVNYANDYSDGIRGTDKDRVGPLRLTGSGLVEPKRVKQAAFASFAIAALAGLVYFNHGYLGRLYMVSAVPPADQVRPLLEFIRQKTHPPLLM